MAPKTVKELVIQAKFYGDGILERDLRQEAIKWVKEDIEQQRCSEDWESLKELQPQIFKWIERFNLTEEDLGETR